MWCWRLSSLLCLIVAFSTNVSSFSDADRKRTIFEPTGISLANAPSSQTQRYGRFRLTLSNPVATLDYGVEVAGYPTFEIESFSGKVQIEVKYAEEFRALHANFSDGPWPYAVALANTYRVETIEIQKTGRLESFLLQGGQKWQSIRLLTDGSVAFSSVGFVASIPAPNVDKLPGGFQCDIEDLNKIWKLGAVAANAACLEKGSQRTMWEVDDQGAYVRGMRSGLSARGAFFENYTLEFDAKIERAGLGWVVAHPLASPAKGIQLNLVGDYPPETTFVNTNTSLTPKNTILLGYGYSFVNQTTLPSYHLDTFTIPFTVKEKTWYRIKTILSEGKYLAVSISNTQIFNVSMKDYYVGKSPYLAEPATIPFRGSFGFGGWQDQVGRFRNVVVYDRNNKSTLYQNPLVDGSQVTAEFGVHENYASVCLDGPKRDRLVWLGDFLHTVRIIGASTSRMDIARDTLQFLVDWQISSGLLPYAPPIGYNATVASDAFSIGGGGPLAGYEVASIILPDYQILGVISFVDYVSMTNDLSFAQQTWSEWKLNLDWILRQVNSTTGLLTLVGAFLGPADGGSAINCALVEALNGMAGVAHVLGDREAEVNYHALADRLAMTINKSLWSDRLGTYILSPGSPNDFSVNGIAFCITSRTANATQAERSIAALSSLKAWPGYKDSTLVNVLDSSTNISPNTNGFLLSALLSVPSQHSARISMELIQSLWTEMLNDKETTTGASWEYVDLQGNPGLGLFTSLSHPWGGAPTYLLTRWAAGLQQAEGTDGFGYKSWVVKPYMGIAMGLKSAAGKVSTPQGIVKVEWKVFNNILHVDIQAPKKTEGVFQMGRTKRVLRNASRFRFEVGL